MLTDTALRSAIDALWDKLWAGGLANPLDAIEQLSFLLFLKRLDEREQDNERAAKLRGKSFTPVFLRPDLRWSHWTQLPAAAALKHVKEEVFPFIKTLGGAGGSFAAQMENAEFKINKPSLLIEACKAIDAMQISAQNQDVQGDLYEYLLSKFNTAGQNGQFRTPRHIIRMMVNMRELPIQDVVCRLFADLTVKQYRIKSGDNADIQHLAAAIPVAQFVVADNAMVDRCERMG